MGQGGQQQRQDMTTVLSTYTVFNSTKVLTSDPKRAKHSSTFARCVMECTLRSNQCTTSARMDDAVPLCGVMDVVNHTLTYST